MRFRGFLAALASLVLGTWALRQAVCGAVERQNAATRSGKLIRRERVDDTLAAAGVGLHADAHGPDLFHGPLGATILGTDDEHDALNPPKGVIQHKALHFAIEPPAPKGARQERPANLHLACRCVVAMIARRTD